MRSWRPRWGDEGVDPGLSNEAARTSTRCPHRRTSREPLSESASTQIDKALQRTLVEKGVCSSDELERTLRAIDLEDGVQDGRSWLR